MDITLIKKRKNIDLPVEVLNKLSILAVSQGKSLKNYIETVLISKANSIRIEIAENPSPSGDEWFDVPENKAIVGRGIADMNSGRMRALSSEEINNLFKI